MTKLQRMLTSLVAAIPAAYLIYVLVMAMLSYSESLSTIAYIVMGLTLLAAATALLIPFGVMFGDRGKPAAPKADVKKSAGDDLEEIDEDIEASDEPSETIEAFDDEESVEAASDFDLADSSEEIATQDSDDAFEDFDLDEEEEEEVKPKSKKKKK